MFQEQFARKLPFQISEDFNPLGGFSWVPRSMVCLTQARGQSQTEAKISLMSQALQLENSDLTDARRSVKCYLADQGAAERKGKRHVIGDVERIEDIVARLKSGALAHHSEEARSVIFLWNAFEIPGIFHLIYNPLQAAFESLDEWDTYYPQLKAICRSLGDPSYRQVHLAKTFADTLSFSLVRSLLRIVGKFSV